VRGLAKPRTPSDPCQSEFRPFLLPELTSGCSCLRLPARICESGFPPSDRVFKTCRMNAPSADRHRVRRSGNLNRHDGNGRQAIGSGSRRNPFAQLIGDALAPAGNVHRDRPRHRDEFGVTRQKFQSTEMEKVDLTCFLVRIPGRAGQPASGRQPSDAHQRQRKVGVVQFPQGLLGRAPTFGWDYCSPQRGEVPADGRARSTARR
jgi:hypothetical protein